MILWRTKKSKSPQSKSIIVTYRLIFISRKVMPIAYWKGQIHFPKFSPRTRNTDHVGWSVGMGKPKSVSKQHQDSQVCKFLSTVCFSLQDYTNTNTSPLRYSCLFLFCFWYSTFLVRFYYTYPTPRPHRLAKAYLVIPISYLMILLSNVKLWR